MALACALSPRAEAAAATIWCSCSGGKMGAVLSDECVASYGARSELTSGCFWPQTGCIASDTRGPLVIRAGGGGVCLH